MQILDRCFIKFKDSFKGIALAQKQAEFFVIYNSLKKQTAQQGYTGGCSSDKVTAS